MPPTVKISQKRGYAGSTLVFRICVERNPMKHHPLDEIDREVSAIRVTGSPAVVLIDGDVSNLPPYLLAKLAIACHQSGVKVIALREPYQRFKGMKGQITYPPTTPYVVIFKAPDCPTSIVRSCNLEVGTTFQEAEIGLTQVD